MQGCWEKALSMKKIYIAGRITGLPLEKALVKFKTAEDMLKSTEYCPVNPMRISPFDENKSWHDYMDDCIKALVKCDGILLLDCWHDSAGARIEKSIAEALKLEIFTITNDF